MDGIANTLASGASRPAAEPGQATMEVVGQLLSAYRRTLRHVDALPAVMLLAARPGRWTLFGWLRRLPRLTLGARILARHHVIRSLDALLRAYAVREATEGLTDTERRDRDNVRLFRGAVPPVHWRFIAIVGVIAVVILARFALSHVPVPLNATEHHNLVDTMKALSLVWRLDETSVNDVLDQFDRGQPRALLVLLVGLLTALCVVVRPFGSAYRVQRAAFNVGTEADSRLDRSSGAWHVPRATGVYELERAAFAGLGATPPRQFHVDLWTGWLAAVVAAVFFSFYRLHQFLGDPSYWWDVFVTFEVGVVALLVLRLAWLHWVARCRAGRPDTWLAPTGVTVPYGQRIGEVRDVRETAGWSITWSLLLVLPPLPVWFRLSAEVRMLRRAQVFALRPGVRPPGAGRWRAAVSTLWFLVVPPVAVASHLWRLARIERTESRSAARIARLWVPALLAAVWANFWFWLDRSTDHPFSGAVPYVAALAVAVSLIQREHNYLLRRMGRPLPYEDSARTAGERPLQAGHAVAPPTPGLHDSRQDDPLSRSAWPPESELTPSAVTDAG